MPKRPLRCVVDLTLKEVTAPGVWLPGQEVYLSVSLFGQYQTTRLFPSIFPLLVYERFRFEKTYYTALDLSEVADYLNDELVIFELVQLSEYTDGVVRLASFSSSAAFFLHPFATKADEYTSTTHEILLSRTIAFNGTSPKLAFSTRTVIKESLSPELDALEHALEEEKEKRSFRKTHRVPTRRARSAKSISLLSYNPNEDDPPPSYRQPTKSSLSHCRSVSVPSIIADIDLVDTTDPRPAFVVRKSDGELIRRVPGNAQGNRNANATRRDKNKNGSNHAKESKSKSRSKSKNEKKDRKAHSSKSGDDIDLERSSLMHHSHVDKVVRDPLHRQPIHLHLSDDEDDSIYITRRRPRSTSTSMRYRYRLRTPPPTAYYALPADLGCDRLDHSHYSVRVEPPPDRIRLLPYYETSLYDLNLQPDFGRTRQFVPMY